jgi:UDP-2,3-diacylglucosamine pyrophosphatase LpxH
VNETATLDIDVREFEAPAVARRWPLRAPRRVRTHRTVFLSDAHLGTRGVEAERLLRFLHDLSCERLYLIGDIVDFSSMRRRWHWRPAHGAVLARILKLQAEGTEVTYVPGNHDWFVRGYDALDIGGVRVARDSIHETADGRRLLVVHGDQFDDSSRLATLLADLAVSCVHGATRLTNIVRRVAGRPYYPLGSRLRARFQHLVPHVARFESAAAGEARRAGLDGVICGHIHIAALKQVGGALYGNTGDWVDSCTAIVEEHSGELSLLDATLERAD